MKIIPGQCYKNSWRYVTENKEWTLVHGLVFNPKIQEYMGHAWAELNDLVYDPTHDATLPLEYYYYIGKVTYTKKYSFEEIMYWSEEVRSYGPWDDKIDSAYHDGKSLWQKYKRSKKHKKSTERCFMPESKITVSWINLLGDAIKFENLPEEFKEKLLLLEKKKKIKNIDVDHCYDNNCSRQQMIAYYCYTITYNDGITEKKRFRYYEEKEVRERIKKNRLLGRKKYLHGLYSEDL